MPQRLLQLSRKSAANASKCFEAAWERLQSPSAHTRLLSLLIIHELVLRSKTCRRRLADSTSQWRVKCIDPLSADAEVRLLHEKALWCLETWASRFGAECPQVRPSRGAADRGPMLMVARAVVCSYPSVGRM